MSDLLLTELERQRKYIDQLPPGFKFPLFNARKALESQRRSGYRNTAAASREIVDNAIEAGAKNVHVVFETTRVGRSSVTAVAFIDDGPGMLPEMARFALTWGGGTHFDEPGFIGRFGFGLPNASINQTRLTEVYTRTTPTGPITKAVLDLNRYADDYGMQEVPPQVEVDALPDFVEQYLKSAKRSFKSGTVVLWKNPDRLSYRTPDHLKRLLTNDFGTTYRYLLDRAEIVVAGTTVTPVDPLFITPDFRFYIPPEKGGAQLVEDVAISVIVRRDPVTMEVLFERVTSSQQMGSEDETVLLTSAFRVRVARFPFGFVRGERKYKTADPDAYARFQIRKTRRGISFVRANREIETVDVFPHERKEDLGDWPLLQGYAYHYGMEVRFEPDLDELFGITNDKQSVRPIETFWKLMHEEGVDAMLRDEQRWQLRERSRERARETADVMANTEGPTASELAAHAADAALGDGAALPPGEVVEARDNLTRAIKEQAKAEGISEEEARERAGQRAKRSKFKVDFIDVEEGPAWIPKRVGLQVVVFVNRAHPFFAEVYAPLLGMPEAARSKAGMDLLLFALAKGELSADGVVRIWYEGQRKKAWSDFLALGLQHLSITLENADEEETQDEEEEVPAGAA